MTRKRTNPITIWPSLLLICLVLLLKDSVEASEQDGGGCSWSHSSQSTRNKRAILGPVDLEKVRMAVIDPATISNQLTGTVLFNWVAYPIAYSILGMLNY